jgi:hypothetical protein
MDQEPGGSARAAVCQFRYSAAQLLTGLEQKYDEATKEEA